MFTLSYLKQITSEDLLCSTRNTVQNRIIKKKKKNRVIT